MKFLRRIVKLLLLAGLLIIAVIVALIILSKWLRPKLPAYLPSKFVVNLNRAICAICGIKIQCYGERINPPALLVANHISWIDIVAILAMQPVIFVSKAEVRQWFMIGWLCEQVGTLFMKRGHFHAMSLATSEMVNTLAMGSYVLFFPEGTTSDGITLKPFHARMFQAAIEASVMVQPIALRYPSNDGISTIAPFIGDDTFLSYSWRILGEREIPVEIGFCPPIAAGDKKRRELAEYAHAEISKKYQMVL